MSSSLNDTLANAASNGSRPPDGATLLGCAPAATRSRLSTALSSTRRPLPAVSKASTAAPVEGSPESFANETLPRSSSSRGNASNETGDESVKLSRVAAASVAERSANSASEPSINQGVARPSAPQTRAAMTAAVRRRVFGIASIDRPVSNLAESARNACRTLERHPLRRTASGSPDRIKRERGDRKTCPKSGGATSLLGGGARPCKRDRIDLHGAGVGRYAPVSTRAATMRATLADAGEFGNSCT